MSKFNKRKGTTKAVNMAGGEAYKETPKLELVSLVLTSFLEDSFYESGSDRLERLNELIKKVDPLFSAKLAVFARREWGMRSVTHAIAAGIADSVSGESWAADFYENVVRRPDDMTEIMALRYASGKATHAMRKGFAKVLSGLSQYSLAKYRSGRKSFKMSDVVSIVRPKPTGAINDLMRDDLKCDDTWESELSAAGSDSERKAKVWRDLISEEKIGQFALLRNLRNICEQADGNTVDTAATLLCEPERIKSSLILPFRYAQAYDALGETSGATKLKTAVSRACDIALDNVPELPGSTMVVLDTSGSMGSGPDSPFGKGALFAAVLVKALGAEFTTFCDYVNPVSVNADAPLLSIRAEIEAKRNNGGTDFNVILPSLRKHYDRIIILSDMQGWIGYRAPTSTLDAYEKAYGKTTVYSFDLTGNGTLEFPKSRIVALAGWSEKVLDLMNTDKTATIKLIEGYSINQKNKHKIDEQ